PVFFIMFRVLHGLTRIGTDGTFDPQYIDKASELFVSLNEKSKMVAFGLDLAVTPVEALQDNFAHGLWYALLVIAMAALFLIQQRMIASRTVNPTMSATQAKIMQYLPVAFAFFQVFLPTGLVVYYAVQAVIRILQQWYITRRFYGDEGALGRQAQQASTKARDMKVEEDKSSSKKKADDSPAAPIVSKRVTPSKNKPSPSGRVNRPTPPGRSGNRHRKPGK
ncbi:MAG: YidC/Oxa1 family membrane protein insertase, partial [Actinomycetota bacterium]